MGSAMTDLGGRTAIVTGGGSGFGAGIARCLAAQGASVAIIDVNGDAARTVASSIGGMALEHDVTSARAVRNACEEIERHLGPAAILVNNVGIGHRPTPLEQMTEDEFDRLFAVNVRSVFVMTRTLVPGMKARGSGVILNIASTGAVRPRPNLTWYNATKGWMVTATKAMAVELAPHGIRVNAINPVAGDTPLLSTFMGEDSPDARARMIGSIPLGRLTTPSDIGAAAAFLCSDAAAMITGVALEVDGGRCV